MTTMTAEKAPELASIRRLSDPKERVRGCAAIIAEAEESIEPHRMRRNAAAVALHRRAQAAGRPIPPVALWRDTLRISRSMWHKLLGEADPERIEELRADLIDVERQIGEVGDEQAPELPRLVAAEKNLTARLARARALCEAIEAIEAECKADPGLDLLTVARQEAEAVREAETRIEQALEVRDAALHGLLSGRFGDVPSNADLARDAGVSPPRIAQMRTAGFRR